MHRSILMHSGARCWRRDKALGKFRGLLQKPKHLIKVKTMLFCTPKFMSALAVLALTTSAAWAADYPVKKLDPPLILDLGERARTAGGNNGVSSTGADISVKLGYSTLLKADLVPTTIVIGSEEVVDVAPVGAMLILTGKALGSTNLHLLDEEKNVILAAVIEVVAAVAPRPVVRVWRVGQEPLEYACGEHDCTLNADAAAGTTVSPELGP